MALMWTGCGIKSIFKSNTTIEFRIFLFPRMGESPWLTW